VNIAFRTKSLKKSCQTLKEASRKWGAENARKIIQRLGEIKAAESLAVLMKLPGPRCHPLSHNRRGQYSVDVKHPRRLVFEPDGEPDGYTDEKGGVLPDKVTQVLILEIVDYHHGR
jgi:proteic killer suppression protein